MTQVYPPIVIPHKHEIIPIHASDVANFMQCRRRWDWSSPTRTNLRRRVELHGIHPNLWFGSGIHWSLRHFYDPVLKRDPVETFLTWFNIQWNGGLIEEDMLDEVYDPFPKLVSGIEGNDGNDSTHFVVNDGRWQVRGMADLLPMSDEEEWFELRDLGIGMMTYYKDYAERNDDFEVIAAESTFSVPLGFESIDLREESPNYGKSIEVHLRGKRDAIVFYPERKDPRWQYGIIDHKTAAKVDEDYFLKLENDPQCTTYIVATRHEAQVGDYPWTDVRDVLYNTLRKVYPKPPTVTTRGFPSINRQEESTTAKMFSDAVQEMGLIDWFHNDAKAQGYYEYLIEQGDKVFIQREPAIRTPHEVDVAYAELQAVAKEMLDPNLVPYKHPSGAPYCTRCAFRVPCLAQDAGDDYREILAQGYELNRGR